MALSSVTALISTANVTAHVMTYINAQGCNQQASAMLRQFILNSLQPVKVDELELRRSQYAVNVAPANQASSDEGVGRTYVVCTHWNGKCRNMNHCV